MSAWLHIQQAYKCRNCGEVKLRHSWEKCDCQSIYRGSPHITNMGGTAANKEE